MSPDDRAALPVAAPVSAEEPSGVLGGAASPARAGEAL